MKKALVAFLALVSVVSWSAALLASTSFRGAQAALIQPALPHHHAVVLAPRILEPNKPVADVSKLNAVMSLVGRTAAEPQVLGTSTSQLNVLSASEAVALGKPGTVLVLNQLKGKVAISDFDIDLKTFALIPNKSYPILNTNIDDLLTGSGFVINPDGYIITSAHVISKNNALSQTVTKVSSRWNEVFKYQLSELSKKELAAYKNYLLKTYDITDISSVDKINALIDSAVAKYVKQYAAPLVDQSIVVVDKSQKKSFLDSGNELAEIFSRGLPVKAVDFDQQYEDSGKDVALILVAARNMPAVALGDSGSITSGDKVFVLGYPGNAVIDASDYFEPTLTQGVISAVKTVDGQKLFQLDTKISHGSSGGPLLDAQGKVLGIITYLTGDNTMGDQFAYALPVELVKDLLKANNIKPGLGKYGTSLLLGFDYQHQQVCQSAIKSFKAAAQTDSRFPVNEQTDPLIADCQSLITSGQSKDSPWDIVRIYIEQSRANAVLTGFLVLLILGFGIFVAIHLIKKYRQQNFNLPPMPMPPSAPLAA